MSDITSYLLYSAQHFHSSILYETQPCVSLPLAQAATKNIRKEKKVALQLKKMLPDLLYFPLKGTITLHVMEEPVYYYYSRVRDMISALKCLKMSRTLLFQLLWYVLHTSIIGHCQCAVLCCLVCPAL